jgi:hypothetical protein
LGVTSAAVSQQVRNLEGWIGRTLFQRRANRTWLTDAGRDYYMKETVLTATGRWDAAHPKELDLQLRADAFDLARLQPLSNEILASEGKLNLDLIVGGTVEL